VGYGLEIPCEGHEVSRRYSHQVEGFIRKPSVYAAAVALQKAGGHFKAGGEEIALFLPEGRRRIQRLSMQGHQVFLREEPTGFFGHFPEGSLERALPRVKHASGVLIERLVLRRTMLPHKQKSFFAGGGAQMQTHRRKNAPMHHHAPSACGV